MEERRNEKREEGSGGDLARQSRQFHRRDWSCTMLEDVTQPPWWGLTPWSLVALVHMT
jgi:hypothetical protein